jgi:UDP-glucose 4-epimerase
VFGNWRPPGHRPVVLDNFVYGHRGALAPAIRVHEGNLGDEAFVGRVLREERIDLVMHFAAFCYVGESVTAPLKYYFNNVVATLHLLNAMLENGVKRFVFSSTCATFGVPATLPIHEGLPQAPINPYGQTKLDIENALKALAHAHGLSFAAFRYFNAAGACRGRHHRRRSRSGNAPDPGRDGRRGRETAPPGTLSAPTTPPRTAPACAITCTSTTSAARTSPSSTGWPNRARSFLQPRHRPAHLESRGHPRRRKLTGRAVKVIESPRRAGDPPALYADSTKAQRELGWRVKLSGHRLDCRHRLEVARRTSPRLRRPLSREHRRWQARTGPDFGVRRVATSPRPPCQRRCRRAGPVKPPGGAGGVPAPCTPGCGPVLQTKAGEAAA